MKLKWWEYPLVAVTAPLIMGVMRYRDYSNQKRRHR